MTTAPRDTVSTANATVATAMLTEWVERGVTQIVAAPGSRSTPLVLAGAEIAADGHVRFCIHLDERSAAFMALGVGLQTGVPAVLVCTSGTAAANFTPAIIEAGLSAVPMIVVTADRPPEARDRGTPQTIDQVELYGSAVRWFVDVAPPDELDAATPKRLAVEAFERAKQGPVHLNLAFREPLVGAPVPAGEAAGDRSALGNVQLESLTPPVESLPGAIHEATRPLLIVGGRSMVPADHLRDVIDRLGWPVLADPASAMRSHRYAVTASDSLLRSGRFSAASIPDAVVRIGRPPASKVLNEWIRGAGCPVVQIGGPGRIDPDHNVVAYASLDELGQLDPGDEKWLGHWQRCNAVAEGAIEAFFDVHRGLCEPQVARIVAETLAPDAELVVSSSMPIRDLEWFGGHAARAKANRGANGIDGVISTAIGVALTGVPTTVLVGDLATLHDATALISLRSRPISLTIVVVDNDGGGIFSFLPQAGLITPDRFETLFGTPTGADFALIARGFGIECRDVADEPGLRAALTDRERIAMIRVKSDRSVNVEVHRELHRAVADAVDAAI